MADLSTSITDQIAKSFDPSFAMTQEFISTKLVSTKSEALLSLVAARQEVVDNKGPQSALDALDRMIKKVS